tara:strand:+ start:663 stop:932 length:270 start_codon:yes stop_codon:yes gene_type:complete
MWQFLIGRMPGLFQSILHREGKAFACYCSGLFINQSPDQTAAPVIGIRFCIYHQTVTLFFTDLLCAVCVHRVLLFLRSLEHTAFTVYGL